MQAGSPASRVEVQAVGTSCNIMSYVIQDVSVTFLVVYCIIAALQISQMPHGCLRRKFHS